MQHLQLYQILAQNLEQHLKGQLPNTMFSQVSQYGVLPPGKLFRPMLAAYTYAHFKGQQNLENEISRFHSCLSYFCSALEIHHAYTLMHDDLPCMDNDNLRRGKASTHIKFGEWQSLLAADGLINISYSLWAKIKDPHMVKILKLATWGLGPRGLILGQAFDLGQEMNESFEKLVWTHQLKTGRLIQLSILGAAILADVRDKKEFKKLRRFSEALGLAFQLIDDLTELCDQNLSSHEKQVNPWPKNYHQTCKRTALELEKIRCHEDLAKTLNLSIYFKSMSEKILTNKMSIENHLGKSLDKLNPVMTALKVLSHL